MADEKIVPTGDSSEEGEASTEEAEKQPQQQSLEEQVKQLMSSLAEQTDLSKRELQSFKDKALKEIESAQARTRLAEDTLTGMEAGFKETDPEAAELAKLRARDLHRTRMDALNVQKQQAEIFGRNFQENINQFITNAGIDPNDKRIDWGVDAKDYLSKQQRILTSVGKIQQENQTKAQKAQEDSLVQKQKDFEAKIRKDLGLDTEETGVSPGVSGTDADFLEKFGKGELPYTKANVERAQKIMNK